MPVVRLSDVIVPEVYQTYTSINSPETTLFFQSGVAVSNPLLLAAFNNGGLTPTIPFWRDLDATAEPNYSTDNPTDRAIPDGVTASSMQTRIADLNQWYSTMNLVVELAGSDPMMRIRERFATYWLRQWEKRLLAICKGLYASNVAHNNSDMVVDRSIDNPGTTAITANNLISGDAFVDALYSLGDQSNQISAIAVHSAIMAQLVKKEMIQYFKPSEDLPAIKTFMGKAVIEDDAMPLVATTDGKGFKYTSVLYGPGAIGYAEGAPQTAPVDVWKDPLAGNGAGQEMIGERKRWIIHPFGYNWNEAHVTGQSPSNANLADSANWTRVVSRKQVPLTFLITNG